MRPSLAVLLALAGGAALAGACARDEPCPKGMRFAPARSQLPASVYCQAPDGHTATWLEFYDTGERRQECPLVDGRPHGEFSAFHKSGRKWIEGRYMGGVKVGKWTLYAPNGEKAAEGSYRTGDFVAGAPVGTVATCEQHASADPIR